MTDNWKRATDTWPLLLALFIGGCFKDFGTGGTGEYVVPPETLREIRAVRTTDFSATRPEEGPAATRAASQPAAEVKLSIEECRQKALANNLFLRVQLFNPTIARQAISEEQARFEALFTGSASYSIIDAPSGSQLQGSESKTFSARPGLEIPLRTGGTISVDMPIDRNETNNSFATLNPAWANDLRARITHPLMRGFGKDVNSHAIRIAFYQSQASEAQTKLEVIRVLADVDRAYWRLLAARRQLEVRKSEYDQADALLARAQRLVKAGKELPIEVTRAEANLADKVQAIIEAENALRDRQRDLKRIINDPDLPMNGATVVIPGTAPDETFFKLDADNVVRVAQQQRMEMLELELRILQESSNIRAARNAMLPLVTMEYAYNINGLGPAYEDALRMLSNKGYEDHSIGLRVEVPLGNEAARSQLRRALASRAQQLATRDHRAKLIEQEVLNAIDQLESNWQRIVAARKRVEVARRLLEQERRMNDAGVKDIFFVLDAATKLGSAELDLARAISEYQIAQVDIAFATGTVLGATAVTWSPIEVPDR